MDARDDGETMDPSRKRRDERKRRCTIKGEQEDKNDAWIDAAAVKTKHSGWLTAAA